MLFLLRDYSIFQEQYWYLFLQKVLIFFCGKDVSVVSWIDNYRV